MHLGSFEKIRRKQVFLSLVVRTQGSLGHAVYKSCELHTHGNLSRTKYDWPERRRAQLEIAVSVWLVFLFFWDTGRGPVLCISKSRRSCGTHLWTSRGSYPRCRSRVTSLCLQYTCRISNISWHIFVSTVGCASGTRLGSGTRCGLGWPGAPFIFEFAGRIWHFPCVSMVKQVSNQVCLCLWEAGAGCSKQSQWRPNCQIELHDSDPAPVASELFPMVILNLPFPGKGIVSATLAEGEQSGWCFNIRSFTQSNDYDFLWSP